MSSIVIILDNSANSPENNPPGSKQWIGGYDVHQPPGILVDKTDTGIQYTIDSSITFLNTWYYDGFEWNSGAQIDGPFVDGLKILLKAVKL
jgi:hypothetical protein